MKIVHFSTTPLAGAPIRLVECLNKSEKIDARLVDLHPSPNYGNDLIFGQDTDLVEELVREADIIHLHNYLDLNSRQFYPVQFDHLRAAGKPIIRQFHSSPDIIAREMDCSIDRVVNTELPSIVIAQFQERFYPRAYVVPNMVPIADGLYLSTNEAPVWDVIYSPTNYFGAWESRWNTKAAFEVQAIFTRLERSAKIRSKIISGEKLSVVLREKRKSRVVLDDLVTGSYHLSGLEGLSLGKPVFAFLDGRTEQVLRIITGAKDVPFINVRLEDTELALKDLLKDRELCEKIGKRSRNWMETYWSEDILVDRYLKVYEKLLHDPSQIRRQTELSLDDPVASYYAIRFPDVIYRSRRANNIKITQRIRFTAQRINEISSIRKITVLIAKVRKRLSWTG